MHSQTSLEALLPVPYGFGDAENPVPKNALPLWDRRPSWKQVHGVKIGEVTQANQDLGEVDAMVTSTPGLPLAVRTADCVPILLVKKDGKQVGAIHAGWRGTLSKIVQAFFQKVGYSDEWFAVIGPSISGDVYEVDESLFNRFEKTFSQHMSSLFLPKPRHVDLPSLNRLELMRLGVRVMGPYPPCTHTSKQTSGKPAYFSFRRDQSPDGRQYSAIWISEN